MKILSTFKRKRCLKLIDEYMNSLDLNLKGLTIFTEIGSGYYLLTPLICLLAGALKVYVISRDSSWGKYSDFKKEAKSIIDEWDLDESRLIFLDAKDKAAIEDSDIITNMNFVRPLTAEMISWMKPTAVIPLMWETWEVREGEVDLECCQDNGILVMGTDEDQLDMFDYAGHLAWYLMSQCEIEVFKNRIFVFASGKVRDGICSVFKNNKLDFKFTSFDMDFDDKYSDNYIAPENKETILEYIKDTDAVVCAEHCFPKTVVGKDGIITAEDLSNVNPQVTFIYKGGVIDYDKFKELDILIYPDKKVAFGHFTTYSYVLGPRAVLELNMAGLKVGQAMAEARIAGKNIEDTKKYALNNSPAMDFN